MKKIRIVIGVSILFSVLAFISATPSIVGKWTVYGHDNSELTATFNSDGTYNANTSTGEVVVTGKYMETEDTLSINDANCGDVWGKYKVTYYGEDSLDLKAISDACADREQGVDGITAKRLKDK